MVVIAVLVPAVVVVAVMVLLAYVWLRWRCGFRPSVRVFVAPIPVSVPVLVFARAVLCRVLYHGVLPRVAT